MFIYLFNNKIHINGSSFRYFKNLGFDGKKIQIYIYNNYGLMKIRANFENIKVQYFEMFKVLKIRFSNMSSLNNKI